MKKTSNFATFVYTKSENKFVEELENYLNLTAPAIFKFFEVATADEKIVITIVTTKAEFDKIFKEKNFWPLDSNVPKSARGCLTKTGEILFLSINDYKNTTHAFSPDEYDKALADCKKTLIHEFVHHVNFLFNKKHNCGRTAKFLEEGIAVYLSKQKDGQQLAYDFTISQLLERDANKSCYNGWFLTTKYLVENYPKNFVLNLFQSSRQAVEFLESELHEKATGYYTNALNK